MIQRYDVDEKANTLCGMEKFVNGRYVLYTDHLAEVAEKVKKEIGRERQALIPIIDDQAEQIAALTAWNKELTEELEATQRELDRARGAKTALTAQEGV
jgi:hypothetical protein